MSLWYYYSENQDSDQKMECKSDFLHICFIIYDNGHVLVYNFHFKRVKIWKRIVTDIFQTKQSEYTVTMYSDF